MGQADGGHHPHPAVGGDAVLTHVGGREHADPPTGQAERHAELAQMVVGVATGVGRRHLGVDDPSSQPEPAAVRCRGDGAH